MGFNIPHRKLNVRYENGLFPFIIVFSAKKGGLNLKIGCFFKEL